MTDPAFPSSGFGADRRQHPREGARVAVRVVLAKGRVLDAVIVDRSFKGMRLRLASDARLPRTVSVLEVQAVVAHEAEVIWSRGHEAGLSVRSSTDVRSTPGHAGETARRQWREAMS